MTSVEGERFLACRKYSSDINALSSLWEVEVELLWRARCNLDTLVGEPELCCFILATWKKKTERFTWNNNQQINI